MLSTYECKYINYVFGFLIAYLLKCITKGIIHLFIYCTKVEKKQTKLSLYVKKAAVVQTSLKIDPIIVSVHLHTHANSYVYRHLNTRTSLMPNIYNRVYLIQKVCHTNIAQKMDRTVSFAHQYQIAKPSIKWWYVFISSLSSL